MAFRIALLEVFLGLGQGGEGFGHDLRGLSLLAQEKRAVEVQGRHVIVGAALGGRAVEVVEARIEILGGKPGGDQRADDVGVAGEGRGDGIGGGVGGGLVAELDGDDVADQAGHVLLGEFLLEGVHILSEGFLVVGGQAGLDRGDVGVVDLFGVLGGGDDLIHEGEDFGEVPHREIGVGEAEGKGVAVGSEFQSLLQDGDCSVEALHGDEDLGLAVERFGRVGVVGEGAFVALGGLGEDCGVLLHPLALVAGPDHVVEIAEHHREDGRQSPALGLDRLGEIGGIEFDGILDRDALGPDGFEVLALGEVDEAEDGVKRGLGVAVEGETYLLREDVGIGAGGVVGGQGLPGGEPFPGLGQGVGVGEDFAVGRGGVGVEVGRGCRGLGDRLGCRNGGGRLGGGRLGSGDGGRRRLRLFGGLGERESAGGGEERQRCRDPECGQYGFRRGVHVFSLMLR